MYVLSIITALIACVTCSCAKGPGTSLCATELTYKVNPFTSGEKALTDASIYYATFTAGADDLTIDAAVDTSSGALLINQEDYDFSSDTMIGSKPFVFEDGSKKTIGINTKDSLDIGCMENVSARLLLTSGDSEGKNVLGLGFSDPSRNAHEKGAGFFDQLVKKEGIPNAFSMALCGTRGSSRLILGGIDEYMKFFVRNYIPITEKPGYVVPAQSIRLMDTKKTVGALPTYDHITKEGRRTIIDSSSPFILLPHDVADEMAKLAENAAAKLKGVQFPAGFFRTERGHSIKIVKFASLTQIKQFPYFEITFLGTDGKAKALELSPLHYFKEMDEQNPLIRTFAIRQTHNDVVLGQPFLENHYVYFDRRNNRIGFGNIDVACAP